MNKFRIAILASGKGSNTRAIIEYVNSVRAPNAEITAVISDISNASVLDVAKEYGVYATYIDTGKIGAKFSEDGANAYIEKLKSLNPDLIVLAGFMKILPDTFVSAFHNKIINLHPSLLPSFKGKDAIKQAFDYGVKICGCSVHIVSSELDGGRIIAQKSVDVLPEYNLTMLEDKVHEAEHILLPKVVSDIAMGKIILES